MIRVWTWSKIRGVACQVVRWPEGTSAKWSSHSHTFLTFVSSWWQSSWCWWSSWWWWWWWSLWVQNFPHVCRLLSTRYQLMFPWKKGGEGKRWDREEKKKKDTFPQALHRVEIRWREGGKCTNCTNFQAKPLASLLTNWSHQFLYSIVISLQQLSKITAANAVFWYFLDA